ncbi:pilus assembly protein PilM [Rodentibacter myodis]|uniref:Competence protein ComA n=1 Tax=Rodentibacter myodis TaxID=1907939 RepID=A0A1V3JLA7_9PAST|nr:pilus assembly protein PilM [Rodentibacter myodis]OOF57438.1 competence protein ComA [Rodentibacter myodis]
MPMLYKKRQNLQIGVAQQGNQFQFVWLNSAQQVQFLCLPTENPHIKTTLMARLVQDFPQHHFQLHLIGSIYPHLTWSKTLVLPQVLNAQECEQQCRFVLQKELPVPLEELWFDYTSTPLKQGFRLEIHAVRRQVAGEMQKAYGDLSLNILDVSHYAILRAFRFILGEDRDNSLYLYQDENYCFAIMELAQQLQLLQTSENLTALYEQFCLRFEPEIERVYVYQTENVVSVDLPENWQKVETPLPFIALGNALWQMDLHPISVGLAARFKSHNERD